MITDKIDNIELYTSIPAEAINFIKELTPEIKLGKHTISENIYANVEKYNTKNIELGIFEAHKQYIDIQILLIGQEDIYYQNKEYLQIKTPYNPEKDIVFYSDNIANADKITLDGTNFILLYPHDAHAPQISANEQIQTVLKVVVKVKI